MDRLITPDYLATLSTAGVYNLIDHFSGTMAYVEELRHALCCTKEREAALNSREYIMAGDFWEELHDVEKLLWIEIDRRKWIEKNRKKEAEE